MKLNSPDPRKRQEPHLSSKAPLKRVPDPSRCCPAPCATRRCCLARVGVVARWRPVASRPIRSSYARLARPRGGDAHRSTWRGRASGSGRAPRRGSLRPLRGTRSAISRRSRHSRRCVHGRAPARRQREAAPSTPGSRLCAASPTGDRRRAATTDHFKSRLRMTPRTAAAAVGAGEKLTPLRRLRFDPRWRWRRRPGSW